MLERLRVRAGWKLCCIIALSACCDGKVLESPKTSANSRSAESHPVRYIDAKNPTLVHAIEANDHTERARFVQVEIVDVQNPKQYTTTFRVEYQPKAGETVFLGTFSLFPPDNPGKFIVPTHARVKNEGAIVLSLVIPDDYKSGDVLRAGVGNIQFLSKEDS